MTPAHQILHFPELVMLRPPELHFPRHPNTATVVGAQRHYFLINCRIIRMRDSIAFEDDSVPMEELIRTADPEPAVGILRKAAAVNSWKTPELPAIEPNQSDAGADPKVAIVSLQKALDGGSRQPVGGGPLPYCVTGAGRIVQR